MLRQQRRKILKSGYRIRGKIVDNECRIELLVRNPSDDGLNKQITGVIDTGCTSNAIRSDLVDVLKLPQIDERDVHGFGGKKRSPVVLAKITVITEQGQVSKLTEMVVGDEDEMRDLLLFGMDSIAGSVLTVDGIKNKWEWKVMRPK